MQLCNFKTLKKAPFLFKMATLALQKDLICIAIVVVLHAKRASLPSKSIPLGLQESPFWRKIRHPPPPLHTNNVSENSRIDFSFVTDFYCMYDICIRRTKPTVCLPRITFLAIMLTDNWFRNDLYSFSFTTLQYTKYALVLYTKVNLIIEKPINSESFLQFLRNCLCFLMVNYFHLFAKIS